MNGAIHVNNVQIKSLKHTLKFKFEAGTSRGTLKTKEVHYILIQTSSNIIGIGECCVLKGLSYDDRPGYDSKLRESCNYLIENFPSSMDGLRNSFIAMQMEEWPSMKAGFEMAFLDFWMGGKRELFKNQFLSGKPIPINGLIWMGSREFMLEQIEKKLEQGFSTLKMKIGAIDFDTELSLLRKIRSRFGPDEIVLRVDANGAFRYEEALLKLGQLSNYHIHSIEQPLPPGQWNELASLCHKTPIPIALDEELIGLTNEVQRINMLDHIKPQYIILKPSLVGGFHESDNWINLANERNIGWWITSALESNIGLNAIAQYTFGKGVKMEQGLGTGQLYENNISSPLYIDKGSLKFAPSGTWDLSLLGM